MATPEHERHAGGRPLLFTDVDDLQRRIDEYFESRKATRTVVDKHGNKVTEDYMLPAHLMGLARALDCSRQTLVNYGYKDKYFDTIARARAKCAEYAADQLYIGNDRGAKFDLINNYGWVDRQEINQTVTVNTYDAIAAARARVQLIGGNEPAALAPGQSDTETIDAVVVDNDSD